MAYRKEPIIEPFNPDMQLSYGELEKRAVLGRYAYIALTGQDCGPLPIITPPRLRYRLIKTDGE